MIIRNTADAYLQVISAWDNRESCIIASKRTPVQVINYINRPDNTNVIRGVVVPTSGRTGENKYVLSSWDSVLERCKVVNDYLKWQPGDKVIICTRNNLAFDLTSSRLPAVKAGCNVISLLGFTNLFEAIQVHSPKWVITDYMYLIAMAEKMGAIDNSINIIMQGKSVDQYRWAAYKELYANPTLISYGSTEAGTIAFAKSYNEYEPILECRLNKNSLIETRSAGTAQAYLTPKPRKIPIDEEGWYTTEDAAFYSGGKYTLKSRL